MTELTNKQRTDIETCLYFVPCNKKHKNKGVGVKMFLEWSERGEHKDKLPARLCTSYFQHLYWGKVWRGRHVHEIYEPAVLDGAGYASFVNEDTPRSVVDFLKKEMFKGIDADRIERLYTA